MAAIGETILALDYNGIRDKVISVMGAGTTTRGYGQAIGSSEAAAEAIITDDIWNELRYDLVNILLHQSGVQPTVPLAVEGQVIRYGEDHPVTRYNTLIDEAVITRFSIGTNRSLITAKESESTGTDWSDNATCTATVTFDTADKARWFFNAGGKIRFYSALEADVTTATNSMWGNLLDAAGLIQFGANTNTNVQYYDLTNSFQVISKNYAPGNYSGPYFQISAKCDVANNALGTATTLTFALEWNNDSSLYGAYGPYGGVVTGTLAAFMDELKATGPIFPAGTFTIDSPIYSMTSIVVSS